MKSKQIWTPARVKALRKRLGLSQMELATRVGASSTAVISAWENGHQKPSRKNVAALDALSGTRPNHE